MMIRSRRQVNIKPRTDMPPRRTTRSKAEEPQAVSADMPPKKRATRASGGSEVTAAAAPQRTSRTRGAATRKPVIESSDEDELALGGKNMNVDVVEEEESTALRPKRSAKPSSKTSSSNSRKSSATEGDEENDEHVEPAKQPSRSRKVSGNLAHDEPQRDEARRSSRLSSSVRQPEEDPNSARSDTPTPDLIPSTFARASAKMSKRRSQSMQQRPLSSESLQAPESPPTARRPREVTPEAHANAEPDLTHLITPARPVATPSRPMPVVKQEPKKRLVIHKMVLENFKSYAGRQDIGPFHKSFSAIVGPNGSGKSNTIDALLFVFGYRANKMRQGKLSELIHNSANHQDLDHCSVEIWFREIVDLPGPDKYLVVPDSQLVVARTAFRNNSSKYTINNRTSSFTEVTTLLKARGIDLDHKRFLILQGEVESIAQMKPKAPTEHEDGLLEYLEDIIGTSKYKQPIEQAQQDVDTHNEDRADKLNRLRVVEKEKSSLESKKREAEDFLRDTNDLTRKKSLLWQFHMHTLRQNLEITDKTCQQLEQQLEAERERNASHLEEITELQRAYEEKVEATDQVRKHVEDLQRDLKKLEKEEVGLSEKRKHLVSKQKKLKKSLTDEGHAKAEALSWVTNHGEEIERAQARLAELEAKLEREEAELEQVRDSLKGKTEQFTSQIEAKQLELQPWSAKINDKQSALDIAERERTLLLNKAEGVGRALAQAVEALTALEHKEKDKHGELRALTKQKAEQEASLKRAQSSSSSMSPDQLRKKVTAARQRADEAKASRAASTSSGAVLATLTKLRDQGRLRGFHGRLGDLGIIDDKYDVAITTACGALNNLVVDTVEQGQACIDYLRKGNVGRASIMVLEKLPARDLGPIKTPENVPRLFDLIKPKGARFAPAFFKAISNTLVADSLEQAQRIGFGKQRWRVVTLAGQVIDPSGTMSGGGARVQRGGMSSNFAPERVEPEMIAKLDRELEAAEQELASFNQSRQALETEVAGLQKSIPHLEMEIEKLMLDLQTSDKRKADAKARIADLESQAKPDAADEKRISTLEGEIATLGAELQKLSRKSAPIEAQIKELQNHILEIGGVKLRAVQSKVVNTKEQIELANESITKAQVGQSKNERDAEKLEKSIAANEGKLEEIQQELAIVEEDLTGSTNGRQVIEDMLKGASDTMETVQDTLEEAKTELDEKTASINAFRALEMDIKQKLEDNARIQKESKTKLKHWTSRHQELELIAIDEEDDDEEEQAVEGDSASALVEGQEPAAQQPKRPRETSTELPEHTPDELEAVNRDQLNAEIAQLEEEIGKAKPNLNVLAEYRKREADYLERAKDLENTTMLRDQAKKRYDDLRKTRLDEFMTGFSAISSKLKEMYQMITLGGNAELELVDSMDPFSEGIIFSVMPPKKSWKNISNLSGGEKTLSSLALVFALHVFKPTPLYFMDEIDAALDFRNVSIIANYIKSKTEAAQL